MVRLGIEKEKGKSQPVARESLGQKTKHGRQARQAGVRHEFQRDSWAENFIEFVLQAIYMQVL